MTDAPKTNVFPNHSQRFPRASAKASVLVSQLNQMAKRGPRSLIGTVVDATFHVSQGYVYCTTELGYVNVYGVPPGTVVPGMRMYVRQQGPQGSNRAFVFDGYAPTVSSLSSTGSLLYSALPEASGAQLLGTTTASIPCASTLTTAVGYYWHCFFYVASLPGVAATIFSMWTGAVGTNVLLELLPSGLLRFRSGSDSKGYLTTTVVAPHSVHWVQVQPGVAGAELTVDGVVNYAALPAGGTPTFGGGSNLYTLAVLTDPSGNRGCPLGSWISKFGFGSSYAAGAPIPLVLGNVPPQQDADLPNLNASATLQTTALYLCNDTPGSTTSANSAAAGSASQLSLTGALCSVSALGPY